MESQDLISSIDYGKTLKNVSDSDYRRLRDTYDDFIQSPLTLGLFVALSEDGNVLGEPKGTDLDDTFFSMQVDYNLEKEYAQAKERIIFEGFELKSYKPQTQSVSNGFDYLIFYQFSNGNTRISYTDFSNEKMPTIDIKIIEDLIPFNVKYKPKNL